MTKHEPLVHKDPQDDALQGTRAEHSRLSSLYYGWIQVIVLGLTTIISYGTTQYLFGALCRSLTDQARNCYNEEHKEKPLRP